MVAGDSILFGARDESDEAEAMLRRIAEQLEAWARESVQYGWSTHQVDPMRREADAIWRFLYLRSEQRADAIKRSA